MKIDEKISLIKNTIQEIKNRHPKTITGGTTIGPIPDWVQEEVDAYNAS